MTRSPLRSNSLAANSLIASIAIFVFIFTISPPFSYEINRVLKYVYTILLVVMATSVFALRQLKSRVVRARPISTGQVPPGRLAPVTSAQRHV